MMIRTLAYLVALVLVCGSVTACGAKQTREDSKPTAETSDDSDRPDQTGQEVDKPSKKQLADSPCGNPSWAKLPEGAEKKAEESKQDNADKADENDEKSSTD